MNPLPGLAEVYPCDGAPPNIGLLNTKDAEGVWRRGGRSIRIEG